MNDKLFKDILLNEYNAIFLMIDELIEKCSDELWLKEIDEPSFWKQIYHTIYYLDFYMGNSPKKHIERFTIKEDLSKKSDKILSKNDLQMYLQDLMDKSNQKINELTTEEMEGKNSFFWAGPTVSHKLVYNIRHAQHHIGKLNSMLRRHDNKIATWIIDSKKEYSKRQKKK